MKKTYFKPAIKVRALKQRQMLLASSTLGVGSGTKNANEALSRDFYFEDEED